MRTHRNSACAHTPTGKFSSETHSVKLSCCHCGFSVWQHLAVLDATLDKFTVSGWGSVSPQHPKPCCVCFSFVTKTTLVTQPCLSYCWAALPKHQDLLCFSLCHFARRQGEVWEGTELGKLNPADQRYISTPSVHEEESTCRNRGFSISVYLKQKGKSRW